MEAASLWPTEAPVGWLEASLCCIAVWTWAAVAWAVAAVSWPVIVDEDGRAVFSIANLFLLSEKFLDIGTKFLY